MDAAARESGKIFRCQKTNRDVPLRAPRCLDPKSYCKWRPACPVHLLEREERRVTPA